jgi:glutathione S-transferase
LQEKKLEHEIEYIDLDMPPDWFFDVSPLEKVPVLLVDDEPLFESMVICEYLNDISGGDLYPENALSRAHHRAWIELGSAILGTVYDLMQASNEPDFKRARATIIDRLDVLEEEMTEGPFFAGDQFGMVDIAYAPLFRYLTGITRYSGVYFYEDTPEIKAWSEQLLSYPAVIASVPDDYETALKDYLKRPDTILGSRVK